MSNGQYSAANNKSSRGIASNRFKNVRIGSFKIAEQGDTGLWYLVINQTQYIGKDLPSQDHAISLLHGIFTGKGANSAGMNAVIAAMIADGRGSVGTTAVVAPEYTTDPVPSTGGSSFLIGTTLSLSSGVLVGNPTPDVTYQWKKDGVNYSTAATITPVFADLGATFTCDVTATNSEGSDSVLGISFGSMIVILPSFGSNPTLGGASPPTLDQESTVTAGTYLGTSVSVSYQWKIVENSGAVANATGTGNTTISYTPTKAREDEGKVLRCTVTLDNSSLSGGSTVSYDLDYGKIEAIDASITTPPTASTASPKEGVSVTLSGLVSAGTATVTVSYQWTRAGSNIAGATSAAYTPVLADVNNSLAVVVTASNIALYGGATASTTVTVGTVTTDIGTLSIAGATTPAPSTSGSYSIAITGSSTDATYQWTVTTLSAGAGTTINSGATSSTVNIAFNSTASATYTISCTVTSATATDSPKSLSYSVVSATPATPWDNSDRTGIVRIPSLGASILTGQRQSTWEVIDDSANVFGSTSYYPNVSRYNGGLYLGYYNSSTDTPPAYIAVWNITKQSWAVDVDGMEQGYWVATSDTIGQMRYNGLGTDFNPLNDNLIVIGYTTKQDTSTWADYDGPVTPLPTYNLDLSATVTQAGSWYSNADASSHTGTSVPGLTLIGSLSNQPYGAGLRFYFDTTTNRDAFELAYPSGVEQWEFEIDGVTHVAPAGWVWDHASYTTLTDIRANQWTTFTDFSSGGSSGYPHTVGDSFNLKGGGENWRKHHTGFIKYYPVFNNSTGQLIQADTVITDKEGNGLNGGTGVTIVRHFDVQSTGDGFPRGIAMWNGTTSTWSSGKMTVQTGNDYAKTISYDVQAPNNNETWLLFLDTEDVDVSGWTAYDGPKADWDTHADGVYVISQLNTSSKALRAVPSYTATGYTDAPTGMFMSNDGSGNYTPMSSRYDAFPDGDEPPYVAIYINDYTDNVENAYASGAQGWYVFKNDVATNLSTGYGRTSWETPVAWPSDVSSAYGPQDSANGYLGSTQGSHNGHMFVFLDSYTDPVGSGGTDHWSKPPVIVTDTISTVDTTVGDERLWLTDPDQNNPNPIYGGEGQNKLGYYHYASIRGRRWLLYDRGLGSVPFEVYKDSTLMGTGTWNATANDNGVDSLYFTTNSPYASDAAFITDCVVGERMWMILNI